MGIWGRINLRGVPVPRYANAASSSATVTSWDP